VEEVRKVLGLIDRHVGSDGLVVSGKLSLGDCALMPMLFFVVTLAAPMGFGDAPLANFPNLAAALAKANGG